MSITYKEIATFINKSEANMKYLKKTNPAMLEVLKLGSYCKKNNIMLSDLKYLVSLKEEIKKNKTS